MYVPEHRPEGTYWSHRLLLVANDLRESYGERSATGGNRTYILVRYALHTAAFLRRYAADCFTSHADTHQAGDLAAWLLVRAQT